MLLLNFVVHFLVYLYTILYMTIKNIRYKTLGKNLALIVTFTQGFSFVQEVIFARRVTFSRIDFFKLFN